MAEENTTNQDKNKDEYEIDILELLSNLWKQRRKIIKWCVCGAVIGLVVAFSIPKEYTTEVKLAPESSDSSSRSAGLGALASMAGISIGTGGGADAVYPMLYPDVVSSVPFITGLFDVKVKTSGEDSKNMTLEQYLATETRSPWWGYIKAIPGAIISLFKSDEQVGGEHKLDQFQLTKSETRLVNAIRGSIETSVDAKTSVVSIKVTEQDPLVSAMLADTVVSRLQEYITAYRTNKARQDLEYALKLNDEARANYYEAQQRYADYLDRNQNLSLHSAQTTRERLQNEATLAFNLYNQTAQQVQLAQAKVQETTPVYAIITPATVPIIASAPRKMLI
ncbi:MAG: chain-length determining protein, partial [Duncaniella sp.]|nr:chain-length determining protein [Duncaniella sp.]